jgi:hypothetical protein
MVGLEDDTKERLFSSPFTIDVAEVITTIKI